MTRLAESTTFDVQKIRADFPILNEVVHGKPLVYLDNANTTQKPQQVLDALDHYYRHDNANIHRATHLLSERATRAYEGTRVKVQRLINAAHSREVVFTRGCTDSINLVAQSWARTNLKPGDEILVTWMEHHSNIVPWQLVCQQTGATLKVAPITDAGELDLDAFGALLSERTKLLAMIHVSNSLGTINPVAEMIAAARAVGAVTLVDGAQAVPHLPVDVQALGCDFYAFSGHKVYGPTGTGILYGQQALLEAMPPYQGGGDMIASVTFEKTEYNVLPYKFEAGTPNIAGFVGLGAAVDYLAALDRVAAIEYEDALLAYATERVRAIPGVHLIGEARERTSVLSFVLDGVHPHDIGTILDAEGVAVRTGQHCAQPVMDRYGVTATVRASVAIYNTRAEIDALVDGLHKVREVFGSDLRELYQEVILDHNKRPRNFRTIEHPTRTARGHNPLCGDRLTLYLTLDGDRIADVAFEGSGCAISKASASLMTEALKGKTIAQAEALFERFHDVVTSPGDAPVNTDGLGKLAVFAGVREYPARVKCASLAWHTLKAAVATPDAVVSTE
jgi:cysteine desulfurase/selenocysteine lyase